MEQSTIERVDAYWASRLGCAIEDLRAPRVTVVTHSSSLEGYHGVYVLFASHASRAAVVSAPHEELVSVRAAVVDATRDHVLDPAILSAALAPVVASVIGPAAIAYADPSTFVPAPEHAGLRHLTAQDAGALSEFRAACDATEWQHGNVQPAHDPIIALFDRGRIVAAASWEARGPVRHIGVITHPADRRRGLATIIGSAITATALTDDAIPQWQTLLANRPSLTVGRKLGFVERYQSIALRLK